MQDADLHKLADSDLKVVTKRAPTAEERRALLFAWKVCKHVKSNAILYARDGQTVGVGAGQMSRVDSCKMGAMKAQLPLKGTVAASDAFFPFPDGVEEIAKAGATAIIQPGGSVRDQEVIEAADRLGLGDDLYRRATFSALESGCRALPRSGTGPRPVTLKNLSTQESPPHNSPCTSGFRASLRFLRRGAPARVE